MHMRGWIRLTLVIMAGLLLPLTSVRAETAEEAEGPDYVVLRAGFDAMWWPVETELKFRTHRDTWFTQWWIILDGRLGEIRQKIDEHQGTSDETTNDQQRVETWLDARAAELIDLTRTVRPAADQTFNPWCDVEITLIVKGGEPRESQADRSHGYKFFGNRILSLDEVESEQVAAPKGPGPQEVTVTIKPDALIWPVGERVHGSATLVNTGTEAVSISEESLGSMHAAPLSGHPVRWRHLSTTYSSGALPEDIELAPGDVHEFRWSVRYESRYYGGAFGYIAGDYLVFQQDLRIRHEAIVTRVVPALIRIVPAEVTEEDADGEGASE